MKHINRLLGLGMVLLSLSAQVEAAAADGKAIFEGNCAGCHGPQAKGAVGPSLKNAANWKYDLFKRAVLMGKDSQGKALKPPMPLFGQVGFSGKKPTDTQLKALQTYLKTITK